MLTVARLRELLYYDPETGVFTWRVKPNRSICVGAVAGTVHRTGYRLIKIDGVQYLAHRLAWLWMTGTWPSAELDHRTRDRDDNHWEKLREATRTENARNSGAKSTSKLKVKGVFQRKNGSFCAQITVNRKKIHLGTFSTLETASAAYADAAKRFHLQFASLQ